MRHIPFIALILFTLGLPAQAFAWDIPSYSKEGFCNEGINEPELLEEFVREILERFMAKPEERWRSVNLCTSLESRAHATLLTLKRSIEANISQGDIKDCEESSWTPSGNGSYYKLTDCLLDIGERQRVASRRRPVFSLPIYNFFAFCQEKIRKSELAGEEFKFSPGDTHSFCLGHERNALRNIRHVRFEGSNTAPEVVKACDKKISAAKGYGSYKKLHACMLESMKAERRRRIRERPDR